MNENKGKEKYKHTLLQCKTSWDKKKFNIPERQMAEENNAANFRN